MTNKEAFMEYYPESGRADLVLSNNLIDPNGNDSNPVSSAWGMIELCTTPDYSQGRTSEKYSSSSRHQLLNNAKKILRDNGIYWDDGTTPTVGSIKW